MTKSLTDQVADSLIAVGNRVEALEEAGRKDQTQTAQEAGLPADLVSVEQSVWKRFSPRRNPWPALAEYDERVAELELRQAEVHRRLGELNERLRDAPSIDAQAVAQWQLGGEQGPRPEPTAPAISEELERRQLDWQAFTHAVNETLTEKAQYVARHRKRLAKEADDHVERAHTRYLELVDQLAATRQELLELRAAAVWARLYPEQQATQQPQDSLAGGRKQPLVAMGLAGPVAAERVLDALKADAEHLAAACTAEQKLLMEGRSDEIGKPPNTRWANDPQSQAERNKAASEWLHRR